MATKIKPTFVKIWKKYIRMRNLFLYNFYLFKKIIALTNRVEDASECAGFNTSKIGEKNLPH